MRTSSAITVKHHRSPSALFALAMGVGALVSVWHRPSNAADIQPVRLLWHLGPGAESCPTESQIIDRVTTRLGSTAISSSAPRRIRAQIQRQTGLWRAQIQELDPSGHPVGSRNFSASSPDCGPITDAVTLGILLAIDPRAALLSPPASASLSASASASAPPSNPAPPPPPTASCPAPLPVSVPPPPACPQCLHEPEHATSLGLRTLVAKGMLPSFAPGLAFAAMRELDANWKLQFGMFFFPERRSADSRFGFGISAGWFGGCRSIGHTGKLFLDLCGQFEAGAIHSVVYSPIPTHPGDYWWAALAFGPKFSFNLGNSLVSELGFEALTPLYRPEFAVKDENTTVFQSSPVALRGYFGLGLRFP